MVTVENLYVPDKPAGILLSKYTMLQQKKKKKEVQEAKGIYHLVTSELLCKGLFACTSLLTLPLFFAQPVSTLYTRHTLNLFSNQH